MLIPIYLILKLGRYEEHEILQCHFKCFITKWKTQEYAVCTALLISYSTSDTYDT